MKARLIITFAILLLLPAMALAQDGAYEGVDPSGQTVVYWHQYSDDSTQANTMSALIEDFNSSNGYGITVEALHQGHYGTIEDLMNTAILSGELPQFGGGLRQRGGGLGERRRGCGYQPAAQQPGMGHFRR